MDLILPDGTSMEPTAEMKQAAEDEVRRIVHKHRRRAFQETCNPKLIMLDEKTCDIIEAMASLLAQREAKAAKEAAEAVCRAVEKAHLLPCYGKSCPSYNKVHGHRSEFDEPVEAARNAAKVYGE